MALKREMRYVWKDSYALKTDGVKFVGGSPLTIGATVQGASDSSEFMGIAIHNFDVCDVTDNVAVIGIPALVTIYKTTSSSDYEGYSEGLDFHYYPDATTPWDATATFAIGDPIMPTTVTVGSDTYAIWTLATGTSGDIIHAPAKIIDIDVPGIGSGIGYMTILTVPYTFKVA